VRRQATGSPPRSPMTIGSAAFGLACLCLLALAAIVGPATAAAAECPNEAFQRGPSALLPECRAYEMVSPLDKNGGNIGSTLLVHAAPDGSAVSFGSTASFADAPSSPLRGNYIGRRGSNWATEAVDPAQFNHSGMTYRATPVSSRDLRFSLGASRLALTPGAQEGGSNLYLRDNATGIRTLLAATPGEVLFNEVSGFTGGAFLGAATDWSHILIRSTEAIAVGPTEPQPAAGRENLYYLAGGTAHLVNVLPNGTVDPSGAHIGESTVPNQHAISEDGSRIFFQVGFEHTEGPLYVREDGTTTKPISVSRNGAEAGEMKRVEFRLASPDGATVYFTSFNELIEGAGNNALYRYDVPTGEMTAMVPNPPAGGPKAKSVLGASRDGSYVYFSAVAALAEGATEAEGFGVNFYVWHDGTIRWIAQTDSADHEFIYPQKWSVSPNGRFLGFTTATPMTAEDVPSPACPTDFSANNAPEHCLDVYVYEAESAKLTCVSCDGPGRGFSRLGGDGIHEWGMGEEYERTVLDNGTVFFDSPNALLQRDTNGVGDVYAWRGGSDELVSTGTSEQSSTFGDATPDGSNVYFLTEQQLVKQDTDENTDLYDNRELGGLASQWPPGAVAPCEGEGCKGASPGPPPGLPEGSAVGVSSKIAARSCAAVRAQAKKASHKARRLTAHARRAGKRAGAKPQARRLRRQAAAARKRAHRIHQKAATCGRKG